MHINSLFAIYDIISNIYNKFVFIYNKNLYQSLIPTFLIQF